MSYRARDAEVHPSGCNEAREAVHRVYYCLWPTQCVLKSVSHNPGPSEREAGWLAGKARARLILVVWADHATPPATKLASLVMGGVLRCALVRDGVELRLRPSAADLQHLPVAVERSALQLGDFGVGGSELGARGGNVDVAAVHGLFN